MSPFVIVLRVVLAVICGGLIGLEREEKGRPAGFRTHILVCLGAAIIMILSEYMFHTYYIRYGSTSDPLRLGAQVISGIGFLGAGTIMHYGTSIKGLTTAASLWTVAAIGLTLGSGFYLLGIFSSIVVFIILVVFNSVEKNWYKKRSPLNTFEINIRMENNAEALGKVNLILHQYNAMILEMKFQSDEINNSSNNSAPIVLSIIFRLNPGSNVNVIIQEISNIGGIIKVERF
jgi:putative Mg2+ transporter-C (MgtC) family protein